LRAFADQTYNQLPDVSKVANEDLKISLTRSELAILVGIEVISEFEHIFGESYDEILIRRCEAHGKFINFHTDVSHKTMQVALNGDHEYSGGRLVYVTK
jgi:hypothetical protein